MKEKKLLTFPTLLAYWILCVLIFFAFVTMNHFMKFPKVLFIVICVLYVISALSLLILLLKRNKVFYLTEEGIITGKKKMYHWSEVKEIHGRSTPQMKDQMKIIFHDGTSFFSNSAKEEGNCFIVTAKTKSF